MRFLAVLLCFTLLLLSRENPFKTTIQEGELENTTNILTFKPPFIEKKFNFNSSARVIKKVVVHYQNLDGSMDEFELDLDGSIDWQNDFRIIQDIQHIEKVDRSLHHINFREVVNFDDRLKFEVSSKKMRLITKDTRLRDFLIISPHRIVVDFNEIIGVANLDYNIDSFPFEKILITNHSDYYRVVIELSGRYSYTIKNINDGYEIEIY